MTSLPELVSEIQLSHRLGLPKVGLYDHFVGCSKPVYRRNFFGLWKQFTEERITKGYVVCCRRGHTPARETAYDFR